MVRGLPWIALGGWLGCGCLLANPPDYEDPVDHWPIIVARRPTAPIVEVDKGTGTVQTRFEADIRENNVDQILRYRWFLNYDSEQIYQRCGLVAEYLSLPTGEADRTIEHVLYAGDRLPTGECHRLSLVVTDGDWLEGTTSGCAGVADGAHRAIADWWLYVYEPGPSFDDVSLADCLTLAREL